MSFCEERMKEKMAKQMNSLFEAVSDALLLPRRIFPDG